MGRLVRFRSPFTAKQKDANNPAVSVLVNRTIVGRVLVAGGDVSATTKQHQIPAPTVQVNTPVVAHANKEYRKKNITNKNINEKNE